MLHLMHVTHVLSSVSRIIQENSQNCWVSWLVGTKRLLSGHLGWSLGLFGRLRLGKLSLKLNQAVFPAFCFSLCKNYQCISIVVPFFSKRVCFEKLKKNKGKMEHKNGLMLKISSRGVRVQPFIPREGQIRWNFLSKWFLCLTFALFVWDLKMTTEKQVLIPPVSVAASAHFSASVFHSLDTEADELISGQI